MGVALLPAIAGAIAIGVGVMVLLGWALQVKALTTFLPGVTNPMVVSTALCFVLMGTALWLLRREEASAAQRRLAKALSLAVGLIGLLKLAEYSFGWDLGLDQTLATKDAGPFAGQMSFPTAITFVLLGSALLLLDVETRGTRPWQLLTLLAGVFPLLGLIGRLYGVPTLSNIVGGTVVMALHTALTFLVVCLGMLAARPSQGLMKILTSEGPGGLLVRQLFPVTCSLVLIGGWLRLVGERAGLYESEFGVAVFAAFSLLVLAVFIWLTAKTLYRADVERQQTEAALSQSEQQQRFILASIADGVVITDADGVVVSINRAMERLSGWREAEAKGRPYEQVFPLLTSKGVPIPPDERFLARAITAREVAVSRGYDVSLLSKGGRRLPVSIGAAPILGEQEELLGGVDILRDVSHEREVDRMKSSLISTVSHELRTPLTMIQGFSELLLTREVEKKTSREALESINVSAGRLGRLIEDLLSVSRIESGRLDARLVPLDVAAMLEEVIALFGRDRDVRMDGDTGLPSVMADGELLIRILTNLLSNAAKYSPPDTPIVVAAREVGTSVEISVSDRGIGMSKSETSRLFDKFFRADNPEVRTAGGTGLGLYITKNLVEMQGGQIWAESEPGTGSTFRFTLPVAVRAPQVVAP